ncbi:MAG: undecaprenyl-diphosphate phosphatase, partial [Candidatus Moranbacteria bacterium]|nr:undecaprenyl-diphosphate phosphatase [Candidatus Moranbacteria bacterium]
MTILQSVLLGLVQGITEFLPVSSSGHLMLVPYIFGFPEPSISYSAALHMGTLGAVLIYFWRDWLNIFGLKRDMEIYQCNICLLRYLFFGTLPIIIAGYFVNGYDEILSQKTLIVAFMIFVGGAILWSSDRFFSSERSMKNINMKDALIIGLFQIVALVPGISRSGITMATARILKINRVDAARFSFLMGTPVILGAGVLNILKF